MNKLELKSLLSPNETMEIARNRLNLIYERVRADQLGKSEVNRLLNQTVIELADNDYMLSGVDSQDRGYIIELDAQKWADIFKKVIWE